MKEDILLWHLELPEEENWLESEYITLLIKLAEKKLNKKYTKILDIPCGIGRHHKYLRDNGFEVYGIDNNENLIKVAKDRNRGFDKYYEVRDMREINFNEEFDVVLNWFTSFGYFSHEENLKVLENFYNALKPGGLLIFEFPVKWREGYYTMDFGEYLEVNYTERDGFIYNLSSKLYRKEDDKLQFVKELKLRVMIYPPNEIKNMLENLGFKILYIFSSRSLKTVKNDSKELEISNLIEKGITRLTWVCYK